MLHFSQIPLSLRKLVGDTKVFLELKDKLLLYTCTYTHTYGCTYSHTLIHVSERQSSGDQEVEGDQSLPAAFSMPAGSQGGARGGKACCFGVVLDFEARQP